MCIFFCTDEMGEFNKECAGLYLSGPLYSEQEGFLTSAS